MNRMLYGVVAVAATALAFGSPASADQGTGLADAARIVDAIKPEIPQSYWTKARCVAVVPDLKKAAFIVGGEYGKGVMSCRSGASWSAPLFLQLAKGSWGFQAGAEQVDLVLLVMNESGVDKLLNNRITLGADASVAAGPIGRRGAVGTDAALTAEIVSYSRSKGLFAGIDLSGGVLRPDDEANRAAYGRNSSPRTILASREISAPTEAAPFIRALGETAPASSAATPTTGTARSSEPEPRAAARSTTDDDLRARLVDAQQTIDRMLSDTTPSGVGTTGSTDDRSRAGTITVDRARLLQLRQQIEAALASLARK